MIGARRALARLREGNRRFVSGSVTGEAAALADRRAQLLMGQEPFAIILACSDSRVPAEMVFDQGLGDLFVVRVAGNIVAPSQIGSVEFAATQFGTRLVVVMGHSGCGAVTATLDALTQGLKASPGLLSIVQRIEPAVSSLVSRGTPLDEGLIDRAVRANIHASVRQLGDQSTVLVELRSSGELMIVGAEYTLATGEVEFLDVPELTSKEEQA